MGLLDDLNNPANFLHSSRGKCTFCTFLEVLPKEEKALITERVADKTITSSSLSRVLKANGHNINESVISRHRRGDCASGVKG